MAPRRPFLTRPLQRLTTIAVTLASLTVLAIVLPPVASPTIARLTPSLPSEPPALTGRGVLRGLSSNPRAGAPSLGAPAALRPPLLAPVVGSANATVVVYNQTLVNGNDVAANGLSPFWLAVNASSGVVFASDTGGNAVSVVNATSERVITTVAVGQYPNGLAFDPANDELYVANAGSHNDSDIGGPDYHVITSIPVGKQPMGVAYDPDNQRVYVGNWGSGNLSVINGSTNRVMASIAIGSPVGGMAFNAANGALYVADFQYDLHYGPGNVSIVDPATNRVTGNVSVHGPPFDVVYDSLNELLYVSVVQGGEVAVVNGTTNNATTYVGVTSYGSADYIYGMAFDPVNGCVYIADSNATAVAVLNTSTNTIATTVRVSNLPLDVAYDSRTGHVYASDAGTFLGGPDLGGGGGAKLTVLNASNDTVVANVTLGALPQGFAVDSLSHRVWVGDAQNAPTLLNTTDQQVAGIAYLGWQVLSGTYDPDNGYLYLTTNGPGVLVVNRTTDSLAGGVGFGWGTWTIDATVDTQNDWIYVSVLNPNPGSVYAINGSTNKIVASLYMAPYSDEPRSLAFDDQRGLVYVADRGLDRISEITGASATIYANISLSTNATSLAFDPGNGLLYVVEASADAVVALDPTNGSVVATIPVGLRPAGLAFDPVDGCLFVANQGSHNVSVIDGAANHVVGSILVGNGPVAVAADGATGTVYVANWASGTVSIIYPPPEFPVTFNETGLPPGTRWSIDLNGEDNGSTSDSIGFLHSNGSAIPYTVGPVHGYEAQPNSGSVNVSGAAVRVTIHFALARYPLWFNESGLPVGTAWAVTLNGTPYNSVGASIGVTVPDGTFPFNVSNVPGWRLAEYRGTVTVNGSAVTEQLNWTRTVYTVNFEASGLPTGTSWGVSVNGTTHVSSSPQIGFELPNGTEYTFAISSASGYVANSSTGSFAVSGAPVRKNILFTPISSGGAYVEVRAWGNLTTTGGGDPFCLANGSIAETPRWANVSFHAQAANGSGPYAFSWDFGDGSPPADGSDVSHHFQGWGPWTVSVTVVDSNHSTNSTTVNVTVPVPPGPIPVCPRVAGAALAFGYLLLVAGLLAAAVAIVVIERRRRHHR